MTDRDVRYEALEARIAVLEEAMAKSNRQLASIVSHYNKGREALMQFVLSQKDVNEAVKGTIERLAVKVNGWPSQ